MSETRDPEATAAELAERLRGQQARQDELRGRL
jgi:hypothetical protein